MSRHPLPDVQLPREAVRLKPRLARSPLTLRVYAGRRDPILGRGHWLPAQLRDDVRVRAEQDLRTMAHRVRKLQRRDPGGELQRRRRVSEVVTRVSLLERAAACASGFALSVTLG